MLLQRAMPLSLPVELMGPLRGGLGGKAEVEGLQTSLRNLAVATQRPDIDPGPITGVVDARTVTAVVAAQSLLSKELPSWAFLALQAALAAGAMTSIAKEGVEKAAIPLTIAANTAAVKYKVNPALYPMPTTTGFFVPGWWKTPFGIALLAAVGLVGYKLFFADSPAKKAA